MHLEIHDVTDYGNKLVFKLEYDEDFRQTISKLKNKSNISKKEIQQYILEVLENNLNFDDLNRDIS